MRRRAILSVAVICATLLLTATVTARGAAPLTGSPAQGEFAPGQLLIRFLPSVSPGRADEILAERGAAQIRSVAALDVRVLRLPPGLSVEQAVEIFSRIPEVEFAEPNYILRIVDHLPEVSGQWGLQQIRAPEAWSVLDGGGPATLIAITDTGIDSSHTDLAGNIWTNPGESGLDSSGNDKASNGLDDDNNGYVDDIWGWDFVNNDNDPFDDHFHGTLVSSVAAAAKYNGGVAGVCPWCTLAAVKVLDFQGSGFLDTVANGIVYAADNGAQVVNLSLGGAGGSQTLEDAVNHAWNKGALVVAAAGNDGADALLWPAAYQNAMAIASTNDQDFRSCFSNWGENYISVAGPGESIEGATPGQAYGTFSGTSLSTPHVSGLAGLLFSQAEADPAITRSNTDVRSLIEASANDLGPVGLDAYFGTGRINALRAVQGDTTATTPPDGMFTDDLSASGYAHARKLARDASGNLHLVWHGRTGGQYQVLYAKSTDGGATWSSAQEVFSSVAETFHPALATDGSNLFVAFPTKQGSNKYRILFTSKTVDEGSWGPVGTAISGPFHAVRPDLYLDPTTERLHLVASSFDDKPDVYYTSSDDGGQSWDRVTAVNVATGSNQRSRYADIHASGTNVYIAGRTVEFTFFGLVPRYRAVTIRSMNGGSPWTDLTELAAYDGWFSGEYGMSLAGFGDQLYLSYENAGAIYYRSSADGANWSAATNLGGGAWPSITQGSGGQAWALWESGGNLVLRHYTGSSWDAAETLGAGNYPNLKLGTGGNVVDWANTHCSGAPFRITSSSRSLGTNAPPVANAGGTYLGSEDVAIAFDGSGSSDPNGDALTYTWDFGDGATGTGASPIHTYTYGETFTVTLTVSDGKGGSDTDTTTADVTEVNDPPVADPNGPYSGTAGEPIAFDGSGSYDPDNQDGTTANDQILSYTWTFGDAGTGSGVSPSHTYATGEDYTVILTVSDGEDSTSATTAASVSQPNTPPTADDKTNTTDEDTPLTVTLTASDPEACDLAFSIVAFPANGTLSALIDASCTPGTPNADRATVTYSPDPDYNGSDSFTYKAHDGTDDSSIATVSITVNAVNDPPVAMGDTASTSQDTPVTTSVLANDSDVDGDALSVTAASDPTNGSATVNADDTITYTPDTGFTGTESFTYSITDGKGGTDTATVSVTVAQAATPIHVHDLDGQGVKLAKGTWKAIVTIFVHDESGAPVSDAIVTGTFFQNGSAVGPLSCTTGLSGICGIDSKQLPSKSGKATFTVDTITHPMLTYDSGANHDPDGDSNGTSTLISK